MFIRNLKLSNIRRFHSLNLEFNSVEDPSKPRMTTLLIGKNGTCKTTLLRSIVIGLCDRAEGNALLAEEGIRLIGDETKPAEIEITMTSGPRSKPIVFQTTLKRVENRDEVETHTPEDAKSPFLCGYGVGRLADGPMDSGYRYANSTYTFFRYDSYLIYPELAVRRFKDFMDSPLYTRTMKGIKRAAGIPPEDEITVEKGGGVVIKSKLLGKVGLRAWADGLRVPFNLIMDVFSWAMQADAVTKDGRVRGILLIDEIGQLLHPSLELDVLDRIRSLFGEMQLITTSHSPMVALGAHPGDPHARVVEHLQRTDCPFANVRDLRSGGAGSRDCGPTDGCRSRLIYVPAMRA